MEFRFLLKPSRALCGNALDYKLVLSLPKELCPFYFLFPENATTYDHYQPATATAAAKETAP